MMIKFTLLSTKGGVGKTTLAANLGALMADMGLRVLLIDADIQPSLSKYFEIKHKSQYGLTKVIVSGTVTEDCISRTYIDGLDIIQSDDSEKMLQSWLMNRIDRGERLSNALDSPAASDEFYDVILIDTQGAAAGALQDTAALAATQIIAPVNPEMLSAREFKSGTMEMLDRLEPSPHSKYRVGPVKAVIYRQDRTSDARSIADSIRQDFNEAQGKAKDMAESIRQDYIRLGGRVSVLNTYVPYAKSYKEAATLRIPVHRHEPSRAGTMASAYDTMHALLWELVPNLAGHFAGASGDSTPDAKGADKGVA
jgi:chromosome partitioning related protein ParA